MTMHHRICPGLALSLGLQETWGLRRRVIIQTFDPSDTDILTLALDQISVENSPKRLSQFKVNGDKHMRFRNLAVMTAFVIVAILAAADLASGQGGGGGGRPAGAGGGNGGGRPTTAGQPSGMGVDRGISTSGTRSDGRADTGRGTASTRSNGRSD